MQQKSKSSILLAKATESLTTEVALSTHQSEIYGWGNDNQGQLGLGNYSYSSNYTNPRFVKYPVHIQKISCGAEHSLMLSETGLVYGMGSNKSGQLGLVFL
jgi:alpha-tubulin suppressor-like RCC1 family protein